MSGTSLDGVDAALVEIDEEIPPASWTLLGFYTRQYTDTERARIAGMIGETVSLPGLTAGNMWLGEVFAQAALAAIDSAGLTPAEVDAVASHGQTVWHIPPAEGQPGATLQLGEPCVIAERTGLLTVADFRPRDIAAGGQGAPLVPFADYLLFHGDAESVVMLNIGGIANVTYLPRGGSPADLVAFDTGPGNMVINALAERLTRGAQAYDIDGALAARGTVRDDLLARLMDHPYFRQAPPKSTGRETFGAHYAADIQQFLEWTCERVEDVIATVTALTAESIARAIRDFLPPNIDAVILGGGGRYNPTLVRMLADRLPGIALRAHEDYGIPSDAKEAIAFALLGHATLCGVPNNVPAATGAGHPVILGKIVPGSRGG